MAKNTQLADATVNGQADNMARRLDNGYLRIFAGAQPATGDTALSGETLLAELRFAATSAPAASGGVLTFNALTPDSSANAGGTAAYFRAFQSDGTTPVFDGSVGTSDANLVMSSPTITATQTVSCSGFTHDVKNATATL